jgi:hypothetical protein
MHAALAFPFSLAAFVALLIYGGIKDELGVASAFSATGGFFVFMFVQAFLSSFLDKSFEAVLRRKETTVYAGHSKAMSE